MLKRHFSSPLVLAATLLLCSLVAAKQIEEYINILGGTESKIDFSHGNTLPLLSRPWGFSSWSVQSNLNEQNGWWFHPADRRFLGIRSTHQPSPWINDYGQFLLTAALPSLQNGKDSQFWSGYNPSPAATTWSPYYLKTTLLAYGTSEGQTSIEFAPTSHGGIMRVSFPKVATGYDNSAFAQDRRIAIILNGGNDTSSIKTIDGTTYITGYSTKNNGGVPLADGGVEPANPFRHFFVAAIYLGKDGQDKESAAVAGSWHADSSWAWVNFPPNGGIDVGSVSGQASDLTDTITVRVATSLISEDQAMTNLKREVGAAVSLDEVASQGRAEWRARLERIALVDVGSSYAPAIQEALKTVFYSAQYRASLFPRQLSEVNAAGELVHWSPYSPSGGTYPGPLSADSGFWDAYSTVYPLHTLINTDRLGPEMLTGWLNAYKEGGWLPKWSSPGYRQGMVGTMGDVVLSDAIINDVPGLDQALAYESIRKDAFEAPPEGVQGVGRVCLEGYLANGFIPSNAPMTTGGKCYETVSRTLNYLQSDWAIAQAAAKLGHAVDADVLLQRAANFSHLFNPKTAFFQSKTVTPLLSTGLVASKFSDTFDQFAWGGDYTEAGPWQYRFYLPYDPKGLAALYTAAGADICDALLQAQTSLSAYHIGAYDAEIHEQTEMPENCWGQYEHNNQPVHHVLYMFAAVDPRSTLTGACAAAGQRYLRKAMTALYRPGSDMFAGDEDNGQMSAWFLLSSVGLYSLSPGSGFYNIGSPLFASVEISLGGGKNVAVVAKNHGPENVYVHGVRWNGEDLVEGRIAYSMLKQGGVLEFDMGDKPLQG